ncbi:putative secreted protein [Candidatus Phytoplasma asteris]|uniref:Secreted protein n=1 Tax=Candidatus Phytoplasma asteris TaxID=85620 RepID=A0ABZ2YI50_9MOLU
MIPLLFVFLCYYNYFFGSKKKKIKLIKNIKLKFFCYFKTTIKLYHFLKQSFL